MARKKKDKHGFEECLDMSFLPGKAAAPPLSGGKDMPYFSAEQKRSAAKTAAEQLIARKLAKSRQQEQKTAHSEQAENASHANETERAEETSAAFAAISAASAGKAKSAPHYEGHRQRLRARFLQTGGRDMPDYEFLELLLFRSLPRRDTKPLAKALLAHFGNFGEVFAADTRRLQEVAGCGEAVAADLKIISAAATRILRAELPKRDIFGSWEKIIAYCRAEMAAAEREQFRILFLDKKNGLIADEILQTGTVDHTPVYPRDVVKRALELSASAIILVHNHPSGDPTPSRQDIAMTTKLKQITEAMNITIHDHLIIGRNGYSSFRALDLL